MAPEPTSVQRFTNRVADYARCRPGYPANVVTIAVEHFALPVSARVADVGAGTGKLSVEFLRAGHEVFAIEPNDAMRSAARQLSKWPLFHNMAGTAERLPLRPQSIDLIVVAQAFHWFDQPKTKQEFQRVLRPSGGLLLVWNNRRTAESAFLQEYEKLLLDHCPQYADVGNKHYEENALREFFDGAGYHRVCLGYQQRLDLAAFVGRVFSSSYTPASGAARAQLKQATHQLFNRYATNNTVQIDYNTEMFLGCLHN